METQIDPIVERIKNRYLAIGTIPTFLVLMVFKDHTHSFSLNPKDYDSYQNIIDDQMRYLYCMGLMACRDYPTKSIEELDDNLESIYVAFEADILLVEEGKEPLSKEAVENMMDSSDPGIKRCLGVVSLDKGKDVGKSFAFEVIRKNEKVDLVEVYRDLECLPDFNQQFLNGYVSCIYMQGAIQGAIDSLLDPESTAENKSKKEKLTPVKVHRYPKPGMN